MLKKSFIYTFHPLRHFKNNNSQRKPLMLNLVLKVISANRASLANRASPVHVIGPNTCSFFHAHLDVFFRGTRGIADWQHQKLGMLTLLPLNSLCQTFLSFDWYLIFTFSVSFIAILSNGGTTHFIDATVGYTINYNNNNKFGTSRT